MVFLTIEKWPSDQSQVEDEILTTENNSMGFFFAFVLWGLAKVNESECQHGLLVPDNCRIMTLSLKTRCQLDFLKIGENHSDFASHKLITIFV